MAEEIKVVIQVATAQGKAEIKEFTGTADREFKSLFGSAKKYLGAAAIGGIVAAGTGAMIAGFNRAIDKGSEFEQQQADLQAITGITGDRLEFLGEQAIEQSVKFGESASNIIEAQKLVASQLAEKIDFGTQEGTEELNKIAEQAIVLQKAAGSDLRTAVQTTTAAINQFNLSADESDRIINSIAAGAKFGAAELGAQAQAYQEAGSTAAQANLQFEQLNAGVQVLAANAVTGSRAGTGLRNVITILQTETKKLAENGITDVNLKSDGFAATLGKLKPLLSDTTALTDIFGRENLNAAQILIQNAESVDSMTESVTGTQTAYEQAAVQLDTYKGATAQLSSAIDAQLIPAFKENNGVITDSIRLLSELVISTGDAIRQINRFADRTQRIANIDQSIDSGGILDLLFFGFGDELFGNNEAEQVLIDMMNTTRDVVHEINNLEVDIDFFKEQRKQVEQGSVQWKSYNRALAETQNELASIEQGLLDQKTGLETAITSVEEGSNQYLIWNEMLREVETRLAAINKVAPTTADLTGEQAGQAADAALQTGKYADELERARAAQRPQDQIVSENPFTAIPQTAVDAEMAKMDSIIQGYEKIGDAAKKTGEEADKGMKAGAQATLILADALLQAGIQGGDLLNIVENLAKQLASKALLTGLKIILTGGVGSVSFFGTLFSSFGFAKGGTVQGFAAGGPAFSSTATGGGAVFGPGTTTSDSILARLSRDEHVLTAKDVDNLGGHGNVYRLRKAAAKNRFGGGGAVDLTRIPSSQYPSLDVIDRIVEINRQPRGGDGSDRIVAKLEEQTRRLESTERKINFVVDEFLDAVEVKEIKDQGVGRG